jgi:hypothetical protein
MKGAGMTAKAHGAIHAILMALQAANIGDIAGYTHVLPPKYATAALFLVAAVQALIGVWNHYYNPDGTPAQVAYLPRPK